MWTCGYEVIRARRRRRLSAVSAMESPQTDQASRTAVRAFILLAPCSADHVRVPALPGKATANFETGGLKPSARRNLRRATTRDRVGAASQLSLLKPGSPLILCSILALRPTTEFVLASTTILLVQRRFNGK